MVYSMHIFIRINTMITPQGEKRAYVVFTDKSWLVDEAEVSIEKLHKT